MAADSAIEWTDKTWTPIVGCDAVSPACANCYAALMAARLEAMGQEKYRGVATRVGNRGKWTGKVTLWEPEVLAPLSVRKPKRWFLTSMGDVFHDGVPFEFIDRLFAVMALAPHHTFYVLTKRPDRAANYLACADRAGQAWVAAQRIGIPAGLDRGLVCGCCNAWPLPNVLVGCTAEDQPRADERRQHMERIATAGWRTFVSYEPALGPVDWTGWEFLSWLISGGESGQHARPWHPDWFRAARDFCLPRGIAYMHKQNGEWAANKAMGMRFADRAGKLVMFGPTRAPEYHAYPSYAADGAGPFEVMQRVGKKAAGRLLDGVEHNGVPSPSPTPAAA
jgi:protein gp37